MKTVHSSRNFYSLNLMKKAKEKKCTRRRNGIDSNDRGARSEDNATAFFNIIVVKLPSQETNETKSYINYYEYHCVLWKWN